MQCNTLELHLQFSFTHNRAESLELLSSMVEHKLKCVNVLCPWCQVFYLRVSRPHIVRYFRLTLYIKCLPAMYIP